ncbi:NAD(P)-binding protein [Rhizodiscina lignyota]|uniref:NAD(P)-binding protein n=1 Tax=Rhizodiscina lignyota TaxID=1504668 RepID=A0A9P4IIP6_9PEZI|nr:NAD(P)-binding protein [Rhizodiscina lignyota]
MGSVYRVDQNDLKTLKNKTVLITGGASGIGLATANVVAAASESNNIVVLDRSPRAPRMSISSDRFLYHQCDITNWKQQRAGFEAAAKKFGRIDAVYVNAGIAEFGDQFFDDKLDSEGKLAEPDRRCLTIDMDAACDSVKLAIHYLRKNKEGGSIVMTASLAGYLASAGAPHYSAAKHGIVGLMRALKQEVAKSNIAISVVAPGITVTPILLQNRSGISPSEWGDEMEKVGVPINRADTIALVVADLMRQGKEANGKGVLVQSDRAIDLERGIAKTRETWMSKEMLDLFRSGRDAPLFSRQPTSKI